MAFITSPIHLIGNNVQNVIYLAQDTLGSSCMAVDNLPMQQPVLISYPQINTLPTSESVNQEICDLQPSIFSSLNFYDQSSNLNLPDIEPKTYSSSNQDLPQLIFSDSFDTNYSFNSEQDLIPTSSLVNHVEVNIPAAISENVVSSQPPEVQVNVDNPEYRKVVIPCKYCGKKYHSPNVLRKHIFKYHHKKQKFNCQKCTKYFDSSARLNLHELDHWESGNRCPFSGTKACLLKYTRKAVLKTHLLNVHASDADDNTLNSAENIGKSLYLSTKQSGTNSCKYCSKLFEKPSQLTRHIRIHSGEKPFKCQECGHEFSQKNSLVLHKYTHSKTRPHKCSQCPAAFCQSGNLLTHYRRVHKGKVDENNIFKYCPHCGVVIRTKRCLQEHCHKYHKNVAKQAPENILEKAINGVVSSKRSHSHSSRSSKTTSTTSHSQDSKNRNKSLQNQVCLNEIEKSMPSMPQFILNELPHIPTTSLNEDSMMCNDNLNDIIPPGTLEEPCYGDTNSLSSFNPMNILNTTPSTSGFDYLDLNKLQCVVKPGAPTIILPDYQTNSLNPDQSVIYVHNDANVFENPENNSSNLPFNISFCNEGNNPVTVLFKIVPNKQPDNTDPPEQLQDLQNPSNSSIHATPLQIKMEVVPTELSATNVPPFSTNNIKNKKVLKCFKWPKLPYKCETCPGSFSKSSDLIRHTRIHTGEKSFICSKCNRGFSLKSTLKVHQAVHEKVKNKPKAKAQNVKKSKIKNSAKTDNTVVENSIIF